jgi:hypothetical protein
MTDLMKNKPIRRRVSLAIRGVLALIVLMLFAFVLR